jgi:hypothetical protein
LPIKGFFDSPAAAGSLRMTGPYHTQLSRVEKRAHEDVRAYTIFVILRRAGRGVRLYVQDFRALAVQGPTQSFCI